MAQFHLLGPVEIRVAGELFALGPPKQRAVFAALAVDAGRLVPVSTLVARAWDDPPPAEARNALYAHIMRLRRTLAQAAGAAGAAGADWRLEHGSGGYLLRIEADDVDLHRLRRLIDLARAADCPDERREQLLEQALGLWRGAPFAGLSGAWLDRVREGCEQQLVNAMVAWAQVELRLGRPEAVLARVPAWLEEHQLVEPLSAVLMRALCAAGRPAEALERFAATRARLVEELGVEPGAELRQLHRAILRGEPAGPGAVAAEVTSVATPPVPAAPSPVPADPAPVPAGPAPAPPGGSAAPDGNTTPDGSAAPDGGEAPDGTAGDGRTDGGTTHGGTATGPPQPGATAEAAGAARPEAGTESPHRAGAAAPSQLPRDAPVFTGRQAELDRLDAALAVGGEHSAPVVAVLSGTAGVGKTTLAVRWAHRVANRFPDGQLYADLRGFDQAGEPLAPAEVLRGFLEALEVPAPTIPASAAAQATLYRGLLADRRCLVVLDNARDAEQVRPLLPATGHCLVVVTSREQLAGLVAVEGAHAVGLDLLSPAEAQELLARRLGAQRVAAEPDAVAEMIERCARLPLALAVVAARAATHPGFALSQLAAELGDIRRGLDPFTAGDTATDLRAVFSWSYRTLSAPAARLFRLLSVGPGPEISAPAAASLAALPLRSAWAALAELARAHMVTEPSPGRFACHDLLRTYAAEQAEEIDSPDDRRAATQRLLDHHLHSAAAADALLDPHRDPVELPAPLAAVAPESYDDAEQALAWLSGQQPTLLAAIELAARERLHTHGWQLAWALTTFFERQGSWHRQVLVQRTGLECARRAGHQAGQAHASRCLGRAYTRLGEDLMAGIHFGQARDLLAAMGDQIGLARVHLHLSWTRGNGGDTQGAVDEAGRALGLFTAAGHVAGQARALNTLGWYQAQQGNHRQALSSCRRALTLVQDSGDLHGQADTWDSIGYAHHHLGEHRRAAACYRRAIALYRDTGGRHGEADSLDRLGDTLQAQGEQLAARRAWQQALAILEELGHPGAAGLREKLSPTPRANRTG